MEQKQKTQKFYAASDGKGMLQLTTVLGGNNISISMSDNKLNWVTIFLDETQSEALKKFMREFDI